MAAVVAVAQPNHPQGSLRTPSMSNCSWSSGASNNFIVFRLILLSVLLSVLDI